MNKNRYLISILLLITLLATACAKNKHSTLLEERGMFKKTIHIRSLPTKAKILINGNEIGTTPLNYKLAHESDRMINITAIPLYPNQYTQNIFLMIPPVPKTMTIYMTHFPEDFERNKDQEFVPPAKPEPQVIVKTKVDTVYVERILEKTEVIALPVIYFDLDQSVIKASEMQKLDSLIPLLKESPEYELDILGFADPRASQEYNLKLTQRRADTIKLYLINKGIAANRLNALGHGIVSGLATPKTEEEYAENRKVIFALRKKP